MTAHTPAPHKDDGLSQAARLTPNAFDAFGLPAFVLGALTKKGITTPTPIQTQSIPEALQGKDILASAQTGSGKTLAFLIPMVAHLTDNPTSTALILLPTRELARQVEMALRDMTAGRHGFHCANLIGGEPIGKQFFALKKRPRVIIGTPGRICDHLNRRSLDLENTHFLVLDEMDRMLDMGFTDALEEIVSHLPEDRQTLMFSATLPAYIEKQSHKYLSTPIRIAIGSAEKPSVNIDQQLRQTSNGEKFSDLLDELDKRSGSIIVFVNTKRIADQLAEQLRDYDHRAEAIHGDLPQRKRESVVRAFRAQKSRIMVATDVAARGIDVPHVQHVINYDLPLCPEDYIHRIGRTGRAGAKGEALSFLTPTETRKWRAIDAYMNPKKGEKAPRPDFRFSKGRDGGNGGGGGRSDNRRAGPRFGRKDQDFAPRGNSRFDGAPTAARRKPFNDGPKESRSFGDGGPRKPFREPIHNRKDASHGEFHRGSGRSFDRPARDPERHSGREGTKVFERHPGREGRDSAPTSSARPSFKERGSFGRGFADRPQGAFKKGKSPSSSSGGGGGGLKRPPSRDVSMPSPFRKTRRRVTEQ